MGDNTSQIGCIVCPVVRPDADPRQPHNPPVCDGDRALLDRWLVDIANLVAQLASPDHSTGDDSGHRRRDLQGRTRWTTLASGPINGRTTQPSVSGSRERSIPIPVDAVDLTADARQPNPTAVAREWPEDQAGYLAAATTLDQWVRDWRDTLWPDHSLPPATVDEMVSWLRHRLPDACDSHPAIDEIAAEMKALRGALWRVSGLSEPKPEHCFAVECERCHCEMLYRRADNSGDVDCTNPDCQAVYDADTYRQMVATQANPEQAEPETVDAV